MRDANPLVLKLSQSGLLTEEDHVTLANLTLAPRPVPPETVLVEQDGPVESVPLVMSGIAYRYKLLHDGRRQILGLLMPGDFCNVQAAVLGRSDHFTATLTECEVVRLPRETMDELTLAPTRIARALWWSTLVDESILRAWLTNMGQQEASRQLAHFLCEFLLRLQVVGQADAHGCRLPLRQDKLADILGITRVHVSRTLAELRDLGLVELSGRYLSVPEFLRLQSYCEFDAAYLHLARRGELPVA